MKAFFKSFYYAGRGVLTTLKKERNFQIHFAMAVLVVAAGMYFQLSGLEWAAVGACIVLMWVFELVNTALERICNAVTREKNPLIKEAKDAAAGACLVVAVFCAIVGIVIFWPRVFP